LSSRSATALKRRIVAGVLVLLSIVLITVYFREPAGGGLHSVQSGGATVLRPFEVGAERVARPFRDAYGWFAGLVHAKSQNAALRAQVDRYPRHAALKHVLVRRGVPINEDVRAPLRGLTAAERTELDAELDQVLQAA